MAMAGFLLVASELTTIRPPGSRNFLLFWRAARWPDNGTGKEILSREGKMTVALVVNGGKG
jgi:hypothetical protein